MDGGISGTSTNSATKKLFLYSGPNAVPGLYKQTCGTTNIIADTWSNISACPSNRGNYIFLIHPNFVFIVSGISVFTILPVTAPTNISTFTT
jgi:hypothetical protein